MEKKQRPVFLSRAEVMARNAAQKAADRRDFKEPCGGLTMYPLGAVLAEAFKKGGEIRTSELLA